MMQAFDMQRKKKSVIKRNIAGNPGQAFNIFNKINNNNDDVQY